MTASDTGITTDVKVMPSNEKIFSKSTKVFLLALGVAEIITGAVALAVEAAIVRVNAGNPEVCSYINAGQGIWCGLVAFILGMLGTAFYEKASRCMYRANIAMAIFSVIVFEVGFILSAITAVYSFNTGLCTSISDLHALVAALCFLELIFAVIHSTILKCGARKVHNTKTVPEIDVQEIGEKSDLLYVEIQEETKSDDKLINDATTDSPADNGDDAKQDDERTPEAVSSKSKTEHTEHHTMNIYIERQNNSEDTADTLTSKTEGPAQPHQEQISNSTAVDDDTDSQYENTARRSSNDVFVEWQIISSNENSYTPPEETSIDIVDDDSTNHETHSTAETGDLLKLATNNENITVDTSVHDTDVAQSGDNEEALSMMVEGRAKDEIASVVESAHSNDSTSTDSSTPEMSSATSSQNTRLTADDSPVIEVAMEEDVPEQLPERSPTTPGSESDSSQRSSTRDKEVTRYENIVITSIDYKEENKNDEQDTNNPAESETLLSPTSTSSATKYVSSYTHVLVRNDSSRSERMNTTKPVVIRLQMKNEQE